MKEVFRKLLWNILDDILGFTHTDSRYLGRAGSGWGHFASNLKRLRTSELLGTLDSSTWQTSMSEWRLNPSQAGRMSVPSSNI
jgi:hypothetical protein